MKADQNGHDKDRGHRTISPEVSRQNSIAAHHEVSDVELRGIIIFLAGLTVMTVVVYLLMILLFGLLNTREEASDRQTPPSPLAAEKERLPPEPRLQSAPGFAEQLEKEVGIKESDTQLEKDRPKDRTWELDQLQQKWEQYLVQPRDQNGKPEGLSIEQAKQAVLNNGLPARTTTPPKTGAGGPEDYAIEMPTAASSGRMSEKRKQ